MGISGYKLNMVVNSFGLKKKKLVFLMIMMFQDEEVFKIVLRKVWVCKQFLWGLEKGVFYILFKELVLEDLGGF